MKTLLLATALLVSLVPAANAQDADQAKVDAMVQVMKNQYRPGSGKSPSKLADEVARVELYQQFCGPVIEDYRVIAKAARKTFPETVSASYEYFASGFQTLGTKRACGLIAEANPQSIAR